MLFTIHGMLDPHTHLRSLRWAHKGTFRTETEAALAGGYWAIFDMPNTPPSTINRASLDEKLAEIRAQAVCDWGLYVGASQLQLDTYDDLLPDIIGMKMYCNATTGDLLIENPHIREHHFQHWTSRKPIAVHAEEETMAEIIALVRKYRKQTHFCHVCTAREVAYIRAAKAEGLPISAGVCPHHLFLTESDLPHLGSYGMMKPTLKTQADQDALWRGIQEGVIDLVESDHAPHTQAEKASAEPPFGVPGLQTTLPLLFSAVEEKRLTRDRVEELVADAPQRIFGIQLPDETFTVIDLSEKYVINHAQIRSSCGWTPFHGMNGVGKIREVWIRGVKVFDGENVLVEDGFGQAVNQTL